MGKRASSVFSHLRAHNFDTVVVVFFDGGPCPDNGHGTVYNVQAQDGDSISILAGATNDTISTQIMNYSSNNMVQSYGNSFNDSSVLAQANVLPSAPMH